MKIESGFSKPDQWKYIQFSTGPGLFVDIDTSSAGFTTTPLYLTSIRGTGGHWRLQGVNAIYNPTSTGLRVYIQHDDRGPITVAQAVDQKWTIHWVGIEN